MANLNLKNSSLQKVNLTTVYNKIIKMSKNYIQTQPRHKKSSYTTQMKRIVQWFRKQTHEKTRDTVKWPSLRVLDLSLLFA